METLELLATLTGDLPEAMRPLLAQHAGTLSTIAASIDAADDSDAPTWAATLAVCVKDGDGRAAEFDALAAEIKRLRAEIYFDVNGHAEKDSDRAEMIAEAKEAYYAARRMATLIELSCGVEGFVNAFLSTLDLPDGAGLRKSVKVVK